MSSQTPPPAGSLRPQNHLKSPNLRVNKKREHSFEVNVDPRDGANAARIDLFDFLQKSHGPIFDFVMAKIESFGVQREQATSIFFAFLALYLIFGSAARLLCNLIGFGYPMYASVKAVRTKQTEDDTEWLIYWTCFAVLCIIDFFSDGIFQIFPFYYIIKAAFLIYLYLPQTKGSIMFYQRVVDPLVTAIDEKLFS